MKKEFKIFSERWKIMVMKCSHPDKERKMQTTGVAGTSVAAFRCIPAQFEELFGCGPSYVKGSYVYISCY